MVQSQQAAGIGGGYTSGKRVVINKSRTPFMATKNQAVQNNMIGAHFSQEHLKEDQGISSNSNEYRLLKRTASEAQYQHNN